MLSDKQIVAIRKDFNGTKQRVVFNILGDTNRYRIFKMLTRLEEISVSDIAKALGISVPLTSQHLKILEENKMLEKDKRGQKVYFKLKINNKIAELISRTVI